MNEDGKGDSLETTPAVLLAVAEGRADDFLDEVEGHPRGRLDARHEAHDADVDVRFGYEGPAGDGELVLDVAQRLAHDRQPATVRRSDGRNHTLRHFLLEGQRQWHPAVRPRVGPENFRSINTMRHKP